jgi:hypothetical protein
MFAQQLLHGVQGHPRADGQHQVLRRVVNHAVQAARAEQPPCAVRRRKVGQVCTAARHEARRAHRVGVFHQRAHFRLAGGRNDGERRGVVKAVVRLQRAAPVAPDNRVQPFLH